MPEADSPNPSTVNDGRAAPAAPMVHDGAGGDPQASLTLVAVFVGAILVFVIIVALQAFFYRSEEAERSVKIYPIVPEELAKLRASQQEQLNTYRWVDQGRGVAAIPIDRAMELTVRDQGRNPSVAAGPPAQTGGAR